MALIDSRNRESAPSPFSTTGRGRVIVPPSNGLRHSNPLTWTRYSKDANYSISGLGATRQFKRHPGKHFPMVTAQWRESPAEADRAAKAALREHARTSTGAAKSL